MNEPIIKLSTTLPLLRQKKGNITLQELSHATDVPYGTLYSWETNHVQPKSWTQVKSVADFFHISIDQLVFGIKQSIEAENEVLYEPNSPIQIEINGPIEIYIKKKQLKEIGSGKK